VNQEVVSVFWQILDEAYCGLSNVTKEFNVDCPSSCTDVGRLIDFW